MEYEHSTESSSKAVNISLIIGPERNNDDSVKETVSLSKYTVVNNQIRIKEAPKESKLAGLRSELSSEESTDSCDTVNILSYNLS